MCVRREDVHDTLSVTLTAVHGETAVEVTSTHVLLGYKPLVVGIALPKNCAGFQDVSLNFHEASFIPDRWWKGFLTDRRCVARLHLKPLKPWAIGDNVMMLYEGISGHHSFLGRLHQFLNRQRELLRKAQPGNVSLRGNLHDQVRIAYAIPRTIGLVTLSDGRLMNMFPTDLHGDMFGNFYVSSLRKDGLANAQVEELERIVISYINPNAFRQAYALGKNHMQPMKAMSEFKCAAERSRIFGIPLPESAVSYRELRRLAAVNVGIHRIHQYEKVNEAKLTEGRTLAHIHQYYAQWRIDHGLETEFLLR